MSMDGDYCLIRLLITHKIVYRIKVTDKNKNVPDGFQNKTYTDILKKLATKGFTLKKEDKNLEELKNMETSA